VVETDAEHDPGGNNKPLASDQAVETESFSFSREFDLQLIR
jgi:hypothetical protein